MKKKIAIIVLSVLLVISVAYGVIATVATMSFATGNDELIAKNADLVAEYKALSEKHSNEALNNVPITLQAVGSIIDKKSTTHKINEDTVLIIVPYSDSVVDVVKKYASTIPVALKTAEYKTCVIMVLNDNNDCVLGWTIHADKTTSSFVGEYEG
jgi:hypothetical protein